MRQPVKVSVIIPIYNVEDYLPFALQSCVDQTLKDVEFICVNDGSTDNSLKILELYASIDKRIKIINKENGGLPSARNAGIKEACGKFIMFLDSDDHLAKNACERVWIESEEANTDIIVFGTQTIPKNPAPSSWYNWALSVETQRFYGFTPEILFNIPSTKPFVWRQAFSKDLLQRTGMLFDESVKYGEDIIFQLCIFPQANNIAYISDSLYYYRWIRKGSLMETVNRSVEHVMEAHVGIVKCIFDYWASKNIFTKFQQQPLIWAIDFVGDDIANKDFEGKVNIAKSFIESIEKNQLNEYVPLLGKKQSNIYNQLKAISK